MLHTRRLKRLARKIDQAIDLGVAAAFPLVFNIPPPDPLPPWRDLVRIGWRFVRTTAREAALILRKKDG